MITNLISLLIHFFFLAQFSRQLITVLSITTNFKLPGVLNLFPGVVIKMVKKCMFYSPMCTGLVIPCIKFSISKYNGSLK
jgi:hypothetical protein